MGRIPNRENKPILKALLGIIVPGAEGWTGNHRVRGNCKGRDRS